MIYNSENINNSNKTSKELIKSYESEVVCNLKIIYETDIENLTTVLSNISSKMSIANSVLEDPMLTARYIYTKELLEFSQNKLSELLP